MPNDYIQITTNRPDLLTFNPDAFAEQDDYPTELGPVKGYPTETETATQPRRLMLVFQAFNAWFFYVNGYGDNPTFDNWDDAQTASRYVLRVLKGEVIPFGPSERKTVKTPGVQQVTIVPVQMIR